MTATPQDEKIASLITRYGHAGYGVWWLVVEAVAARVESGSDPSVTYPLSKWSHLLSVRGSHVRQCLLKLEVTGLVTVKWSSDDITVRIPNVLKYRDEYSRKSGHTPESVRSKKQNTDTDTDTETDKPLSPIVIGAEPQLSLIPVEEKRGKAWLDASFLRWYANYWNKTGKTDARRAYEKRIKALVGAGGTHEGAEGFLSSQAVEDRKRFESTEDWDWRCRLHPATWLNGQRWEDQAARARASPKGKDFVNDVSQLMQERLERGEKPW